MQFFCFYIIYNYIFKCFTKQRRLTMTSNHNNFSRTIIVTEPKVIEPTQKADQFTYLFTLILRFIKLIEINVFKGLTQSQMLD